MLFEEFPHRNHLLLDGQRYQADNRPVRQSADEDQFTESLSCVTKMRSSRSAKSINC
jgi:hypothetical protein